MQLPYQNQNQPQYPLSPLYKNSEGYHRMMLWYQQQLDRLPVQYQSYEAQTRFGPTHVIIAGATHNPPLVLLPTPDDNSSMWFDFLPALLQRYRIYIPDIIGSLGRSSHYMPSLNNLDYGYWLLDTLASFNLLPADIVAYRYSSPIIFKAAAIDAQQIRRALFFAPSNLIQSGQPGAVSFGRRAQFMWNSLWFEMNQSPTNARNAVLALCTGQAKTNSSGLVRESELMLLGKQALDISVVVRQLSGNLPDYEIAALRCPAAFYFGADDMLFNANKQAEVVWRLLPHAKREIVPGAGGMFLLEKPELVINAIHQFFS